MSTTMIANSSCGLRLRAPFAGAQPLRRPVSAPRARFAFVARAEQQSGKQAQETRDRASDDNPAERAAKEFEEKIANPIADATQEASGLNAEMINRTAGAAKKDEVGAFADTMSFAGLAPEIINGRAAMVGMLAAFGAEANTRAPILKQIQTSPVFVASAFALIILASVIPIIRGADLARKGAGPFTPRAEVWNGRLAMVAFATTILVETWKAGPGLVP